MPQVTIKKNLNSTSRADIRKEVVEWFLEEEPGTGKGNLTSKVNYQVEQYDEITIELHRPAVLNKGFDFTIHVRGIFFKKKKIHTNPSHEDIFSSLKYCYEQNPQQYDSIVKPLLLKIFNCQNYDIRSGKSIGSFIDGKGNTRPIEIILLCIKWLFIEQDITYWNWSGRQMLFSGLKEQNLI